ncbi:FecR domain-containing protein [Porticoccaceae bacterium]|nr:FecR domain-containing protein [Porticoccaceae bacterium]
MTTSTSTDKLSPSRGIGKESIDLAEIEAGEEGVKSITEIIEDEAGLWLVRLDGRQLSRDETRELLAWLRRSDYHREYLTRLARQWDGMAALNKLATLFPLAENETATTRRSRARQPGVGVSAKWLPQWQPLFAFSLMLVVVLVGWQSSLFLGDSSSPHAYVTAVGETGRHVLSDGSVITLNTNTKVQVDYNDKQRKVTLLQGEANFEVAKNTQQPFVVYAGKGVVQAVGTAFNVRLSGSEYKDLVDVIVTEGRVNVINQYSESAEQPAKSSNPSSQRSLDAGQRVQYSDASESVEEIPTEAEVIQRKLAWQEGSLAFKGETLAQALAEISRYTHKELLIADASLNSLEVGGRYRTDDIDNLLTSLADVMGIDITFLPGEKIQLSEKK